MKLAWSDLPYRHKTKKLIESSGSMEKNAYVEAFMDQFRSLDSDHHACFLFPESFTSQYFVIMEVCKNAEDLYPVRSLFPDETKVHYLAVFDKKHMENILLMYHLLYTVVSRLFRKFSFDRLGDGSYPTRISASSMSSSRRCSMFI